MPNKTYNIEMMEVHTKVNKAFVQRNRLKEVHKDKLIRILRNGAINILNRQGVQNYVLGTDARVFVNRDRREYNTTDQYVVVATFFVVRDVEPEHKEAVEEVINRDTAHALTIATGYFSARQ